MVETVAVRAGCEPHHTPLPAGPGTGRTKDYELSIFSYHGTGAVSF